VHAQSKEELKNTLLGWYDEYRQTGLVLYRGEERELDLYTHEQMASRFAEVLDGVSAGRVSHAAAAHV
jgi:hypothetical protein